MKKSTFILVALALFACTLAIAAAHPEGYSDKALDMTKEWGCNDGEHDHMGVHCEEICRDDKCCKHAGKVFDRCHEHSCDQCVVKELCDHCGKKSYCDGICEECGEPCTVFEYCPSCGAKYLTGLADARCDVCGKDCFCFEKCEKCGHSHYFNGFCDECASKCEFLRCCLDVCDMHEHDSPCDCKEHAPACDKMPERCNCEDKGGYAESGLGGRMEQPIAAGNYPAVQDEATIVIMPLDVAASAN